MSSESEPAGAAETSAGLAGTGLPGTGLAGAFNFRDLGGLPTGDGRRTRRGLLYRSDTLQALTEDDAAHLIEALRVALVIDLRTAGEAVAEGRGRLGESALSYLNIPLDEAPAAGTPAWAGGGAGASDGVRADSRAGATSGVGAGRGPDGAEVAGGAGANDAAGVGPTLDFYLRSLQVGAPGLLLALQVLAVALTRPVVVHCAAGKDRTGLVSALTLGVAGVSDEAIVADYMATGANMARINERFQTWPRYREHMTVADPELYRVDETVIRAFLRELHRRYGGARAWAQQHGVPEPLLDMLATRLTEPAEG